MKRNILLLVIIITQFMALEAQVVVEEGKMASIKQLVEQYQLYSQMTFDGTKIDQDYTENFVLLFDTTLLQPVFNDLAATSGLTFEFETPADYVKYVNTNFPYGIDVAIDLNKMKVVNTFNKKKLNKHGFVVEIDKKVTGLFQSNKFYRATHKQYIFVREVVGAKKSGYLITGILDESSYKRYVGNEGSAGLFVGLVGGYGMTSIVNEAATSSNTFTFSTGMTAHYGLQVGYMFTRTIGLFTGFVLNSYESDYTIESYNDQSPTLMADIEGDYYYPILSVNNLIEHYTIKSNEIPAFLRLRFGKGRGGLYFDAGVIMAFNSATYALEGFAERSGYYPDLFDVTLTDIPEYGFTSNNFQNEEVEFETVSSSMSLYSGLGISFPIGGNLFMSLGGSARYGLTDMMLSEPHQDYDFSNFIDEVGVTNTVKLSGDIGIYYRF